MRYEKTTRDVVESYFKKGYLPNIKEVADSKKELKEDFKYSFEELLANDVNPLLAFQVLFHRLQEIANVAKEVFYGPAIEWLKENDGSGEHFGAKVSLKKSESWSVVKSPKILKLEKELTGLDTKNQKTIKAFEKYNIDRKSIEKQIKAEEDALIEKGFGTKTEEKHTISLSY